MRPMGYLSNGERVQGVGGLREVLRGFPGCKHGPIIQHWHAHLPDKKRKSDNCRREQVFQSRRSAMRAACII